MTCRLRIVELTLRALNLSGLGHRKQAQNGAVGRTPRSASKLELTVAVAVGDGS
jgi:hypothetical protein